MEPPADTVEIYCLPGMGGRLNGGLGKELMWRGFTTDNVAAALLKAMDLGDYADSVGAVGEQLAGARYGFSAILVNWLDAVVKSREIVHRSNSLFSARQPIQ